MCGRLRLIMQRDTVKAVLDAYRQIKAADSAGWKCVANSGGSTLTISSSGRCGAGRGMVRRACKNIYLITLS